MTRLTIVEPGPLTLVQDLGRPGLSAIGVGASGAMDRSALALGNRLVGNAPDAAGLEILLGGLTLRFDRPAWFAVTGAWGELTMGGRPIEPVRAVKAEVGSEVRIGPAAAGIRYYLAVRGGIAVPPVLGSRSRDTLGALGPDPLYRGNIIAIGPEPESSVPAVDLVQLGPPPASNVDLAVRPGPRRDWFDAASWDRLLGELWTVSPRSDRTGIRLEGDPLTRIRATELPSEGMLLGAIQVSPDGSPTILGVDHPVTGGYPVIGVVTDASLDALAQLRPGQRVTLTLATGHF